jgi:hypothetical protein
MFVHVSYSQPIGGIRTDGKDEEDALGPLLDNSVNRAVGGEAVQDSSPPMAQEVAGRQHNKLRAVPNRLVIGPFERRPTGRRALDADEDSLPLTHLTLLQRVWT